MQPTKHHQRHVSRNHKLHKQYVIRHERGVACSTVGGLLTYTLLHITTQAFIIKDRDIVAHHLNYLNTNMATTISIRVFT